MVDTTAEETKVHFNNDMQRKTKGRLEAQHREGAKRLDSPVAANVLHDEFRWQDYQFVRNHALPKEPEAFQGTGK
jgi:hypothetical protein